MQTPSPFSDSAGVPWDGRTFEQNPWSNDDGTCPPKLALILRQISEGLATVEALVAGLHGNRLLVPLLAELGDSGLGAHGQVVDKSAELSIVAVSTPDGATAIPSFTDVSAMRRWNPTARPVPVSVDKLAVAAVGEGHTRVIVNPGSESIALRRTQLKALALGEGWQRPDYSHPVLELVTSACRKRSEVSGLNLIWHDPMGTLAGPELQIELLLPLGYSANQLNELLGLLVADLGSANLNELVDSFGFKVSPAH